MSSLGFENSFLEKRKSSEERQPLSANSTAGPSTAASRKQFTRARYPYPQNWECKPVVPLKEITRRDREVTVFAVVKHHQKPKQTRGPDELLSFVLIDPSLPPGHRGIQVLCFMEDRKYMPNIEQDGDIIKLPLRVSFFNGAIQLRTHDGLFPWVTFDGTSVPVVPTYSSSNPFECSSNDLAIAKRLQAWSFSMGIIESQSNDVKINGDESQLNESLSKDTRPGGEGGKLENDTTDTRRLDEATIERRKDEKAATGKRKDENTSLAIEEGNKQKEKRKHRGVIYTGDISFAREALIQYIYRKYGDLLEDGTDQHAQHRVSVSNNKLKKI